MKRHMESHPSQSPKTISRNELKAKLERKDSFFLFEVLPEMYYRKHHLPGALHMAPTDIEATITRLVPDKQSEVVLYCWDEH